MTEPRILHTATLLRDGRVLVAGGNNVSSAELYDPTTGTFGPTGSMTETRGSHIATLLQDGHVLVAGGGSFSGMGDNSAEMYDPETGIFTPTGSMINQCMSGISEATVTAPLLADGRVLVPDGIFDVLRGTAIGSAELYDPMTRTFSQAGPMNLFRNSFTETLLADGRVLFAGDQGAVFAPGVPSLSPAKTRSNDADRASAELYVP
jgi:hypothetical protein